MSARIMPKTALLLLTLALLAFASPLSASAAGGSYILLTLDQISGDSQVDGAKGAIDITSFQFSASNAAPSPGGGSGGKPIYSEFVLTKLQDSASIPLLQSLTTGKAIKSGSIAFYNGQGKKPYLTIKLENVHVTSDAYSAGSDGSRISESLALQAGKVTFTYQAVDAKGQPLPPQTFEYDLGKNVVK
ncbi:Hcp family type VI secretion system effector [Cohnella rhizosphaerae]|uniref:Type VI secretion system tube protein Hcp n=1 Tax=Cohnella rhizosphaerae TaxID=1457232 RepID=A0A9X4KWG9_9BACL|nr:type VI secretion system tube protein Hcp [Cohnella rhizosphaerae]MDG0809317.1 type VI secretion system tube protein Hcp [Cohnella rhizosphaerae]